MTIDENELDMVLTDSLTDNLLQITEGLGNSNDVAIREIEIDLGDNCAIEGAVVYMAGLSNLHSMIDTLLASCKSGEQQGLTAEELLDYFKNVVISTGIVKPLDNMEELFEALLSGNSILLLEGCPRVLAIGTKELTARSVEEPNVQSVVRGPREGFTEVLHWNTAMLRRKIKDRNLWMETMNIGRVTKTDVVVAYVKNIVSEEVLEEVKHRLSLIDVDAILESNYIEEQIEDKQNTPFSTIFNRSDRMSLLLD